MADLEANAAAGLPTSASFKTSYIIVGVIAAAASAATAAYVFYLRSRDLKPHVDSVQNLLDRCQDQVRAIERKLTDLSAGTA